MSTFPFNEELPEPYDVYEVTASSYQEALSVVAQVCSSDHMLTQYGGKFLLIYNGEFTEEVETISLLGRNEKTEETVTTETD